MKKLNKKVQASNYFVNVGDYLRKREHQQSKFLWEKMQDLDEYLHMNHDQYN